MFEKRLPSEKLDRYYQTKGQSDTAGLMVREILQGYWSGRYFSAINQGDTAG